MDKPDRWETLDIATGNGDLVADFSQTVEAIEKGGESLRVALRVTADSVRVAARVSAVFGGPLTALLANLIATAKSGINDIVSSGVYVLGHQTMDNPRGITGWFSDVERSLADPADPKRPQASEFSYTAGMIFLVGAPSLDINFGHAVRGLGDLFNLGDFQVLGQGLIDSFTRKVVETSPSWGSGAYFHPDGGTGGEAPDWERLALVDAIRGVDTITGLVDKGVGYLGPVVSTSNALAQLANVLERRAKSLESLTTIVNDVVSETARLLENVPPVAMIEIPRDQEELLVGGPTKFFERARSAPGLPDFGDTGIVVGVVLLVSSATEYATLRGIFDSQD